jgi:hypothetical protein
MTQIERLEGMMRELLDAHNATVGTAEVGDLMRKARALEDLEQAALGTLPKFIALAKVAEKICAKLEHPTASVTYLDQDELRAALQALEARSQT